MNETLFNFVIDKIRRFHLSPFNQLSHVGTYIREIPVSLDRMYENAVDWEHLPHLHSSSFSRIKVLDSGSWGWRAKLSMEPRSRLTDMEVELVLNREEYCWKTRTLKGLGKGTEIWTHAIPLEEDRIKVIVDFYVPKVPPFLKPVYEDFYITSYKQLYDEDERMMVERQEALDFKHAQKGRKDQKPVLLGKVAELEQKLPYLFEFDDHRFCLNQVNGELLAYSAICPHMLGPLEHEQVHNGVVECPWHAYQFDVRTGRCVSGQRCQLKAAPKITVEPKTGEVFAAHQ